MDKYTCALCGGTLITGRVAIRKSVGAKMRWPFPSDRVFFKSQESEQKSVTVLREGVSHQGFMCEQCGAVVVTKEKWMPETW
jgi:DNA-directed RNA polymerase subunit RPC12/RpoP